MRMLMKTDVDSKSPTTSARDFQRMSRQRRSGHARQHFACDDVLQRLATEKARDLCDGHSAHLAAYLDAPSGDVWCQQHIRQPAQFMIRGQRLKRIGHVERG